MMRLMSRVVSRSRIRCRDERPIKKLMLPMGFEKRERLFLAEVHAGHVNGQLPTNVYGVCPNEARLGAEAAASCPCDWTALSGDCSWGPPAPSHAKPRMAAR
jgi:hypothetical protein